ncbi:MAG: sensor histidine kinase, partial [Candidatus Limnocylindria bacterium]
GTILAGDLPAPAAIALARELVPPALVSGADHEVAGAAGVDSALAVRVGPGLALVAAGTRRRLDEADLGLIRALGDIAHARITAIGERDRAKAEMDRLSALIEDLRRDVRVRDDAVAAAVHELRNPLTSVHGYAQLMARNLDAVQRQVVQLERLIADLLRAPGEAEPGFAPVDLAVEAHEAARRAELAGNVQVTIEKRGECPPVRADAVRITQLLDNLIGNAVKFSPPGSQIDVTLERIDAVLRLSVADQGIGIAPEELQRIFERYRRGDHAADVPGLGIGLTLCRDIVEAHGGRIWAESEGLGKGSTFHVELPIAVAMTVREVEAS